MTDPRQALGAVREQVGKAVIGQDLVVSGLLAALLVRGHVILEGVPGTAKTLMVKALARSLDLGFRRIQLAPDLMPSDVTGNVVYEGSTGEFRFRPGPVFTHLLLADEINRTPPKTQAALLEAMEERQVTTEGESRPLPEPFLVAATQNPIEFEGTYPLPEAQLDRFLFKLSVSYPGRDAERAVLGMHHAGKDPHDLDALGVQPVAGADDLRAGSDAVTAIRVDDQVMAYVLDLVEETRRTPSLSLGVSPRGAAMLLLAAKAWALLQGRTYVTPEDVKSIGPDVLRHRIILTYEAEAQAVTSDAIIKKVFNTVPVP